MTFEESIAKLNEVRRNGLLNLTHAGKYDLKVERCIGMSFVAEEGGWDSVEWCFMEYPWHYDEELDRLMAENNPFRDVKVTKLGRYDFEG